MCDLAREVILVVSDEQLEALAELFEGGEWPAGETRIVHGFPAKLKEELEPIDYDMPSRGLAEEGISALTNPE